MGPWLAVLCLVVGLQSVTWAQNVRIIANHPAGLTRLLVDVPALIQVGTTGTPPQPQYVYQPAGRFQLWTGATVADGGNPLVAGDENRPIASLEVPGADWAVTSFTSKLTVAVDGASLISLEISG